jgi:hypothetical protein
LSFAESSTPSGNVHGKVGFHHDGIGPHNAHELAFGDQLAGPFDEGHQDVHGPTAQADRLAAIKQRSLVNQQAEWSK